MSRWTVVCGLVLLSGLLQPSRVEAKEMARDGRVVFASHRGRSLDVCSEIDPFAVGFPEFQIYVMNADGTDQTRIYETDGFEFWPRWSPDGERILFEGVQGDLCTPALFTMDPDGTDVMRLTLDSLNAAEPDWSPDGTHIVSHDDSCFTCESYVSDVMVMHGDGTGMRRVTSPGFGDNYGATFSPDGKQIAVSHDDVDGSPTQILRINGNGSGLKAVTDDESFNQRADWGPR